MKGQEENVRENKMRWKEENKRYLIEMQKFLDRVDNIEDEKLKESIIYQMLRCDKILTEISEEMFKKCYEQGKRETLKNNV